MAVVVGVSDVTVAASDGGMMTVVVVVVYRHDDMLVEFRRSFVRDSI